MRHLAQAVRDCLFCERGWTGHLSQSRIWIDPTAGRPLPVEILQRSPSAAIEALRPRQVAVPGRCQDHPCGGASAVPRRARATAVGGASPSLRSSRNALPAGVDGECRRCAVSADSPAHLPKFISGLPPGPEAGAVVIFGLNELRRSDGFSDLPGVSTERRLLWFSGRLSDEREPGHQIECGSFQYRDLGRRHMASKDHFEAQRQCRGRHGQQFSAGESRRERIAPDPLTDNRPVEGRKAGSEPCRATL